MLYTYIPSAIKCRVFGIELEGLSKDTIVTIERQEPLYSFRKAQDGSQVAFTDSVATFRVTMYVEQVSPSNEFLHTLYKLQEKVGANLKMPVSVIEDRKGGGTAFTAFDCFFEAEPMAEFTEDSTSRQWTFICHNASYTLRGTNDAGFLTDALRGIIRVIELAQAADIDLTVIEETIDAAMRATQKKLKELF